MRFLIAGLALALAWVASFPAVQQSAALTFIGSVCSWIGKTFSAALSLIASAGSWIGETFSAALTLIGSAGSWIGETFSAALQFCQICGSWISENFIAALRHCGSTRHDIGSMWRSLKSIQYGDYLGMLVQLTRNWTGFGESWGLADWTSIRFSAPWVLGIGGCRFFLWSKKLDHYVKKLDWRFVRWIKKLGWVADEEEVTEQDGAAQGCLAYFEDIEPHDVAALPTPFPVFVSCIVPLLLYPFKSTAVADAVLVGWASGAVVAIVPLPGHRFVRLDDKHDSNVKWWEVDMVLSVLFCSMAVLGWKSAGFFLIVFFIAFCRIDGLKWRLGYGYTNWHGHGHGNGHGKPRPTREGGCSWIDWVAYAAMFCCVVALVSKYDPEVALKVASEID